MSKVVYVSTKMYDEVVERLGYCPSNLVATSYIEDDQSLIVDEDKLSKYSFRRDLSRGPNSSDPPS